MIILNNGTEIETTIIESQKQNIMGFDREVMMFWQALLWQRLPLWRAVWLALSN